MHKLGPWIETPESRAALLAIRRVAECVGSNGQRREINPLFLHGPAGTGKSHLVANLIEETAAQRANLTATILAAGDLGLALRADEEGMPPAILDEVRQADLLVIEDLQHLSGRVVEAMVSVI